LTGPSRTTDVGSVLADISLEEAVHCGLPLRLTFGVVLWRDGFFDSLEGTETWTAVLMHEPLDGNYTVIARANPTEAKQVQTYAAARGELEGDYLLAIRPARPENSDSPLRRRVRRDICKS
jgi:hypothetical protein